MRSFCMGIAGALLAFTLTGCGETVDEGPREFKGTKDPSIDALRDNMAKTLKAGDHKKKPVAETTKPAATLQSRPMLKQPTARRQRRRTDRRDAAVFDSDRQRCAVRHPPTAFE